MERISFQALLQKVLDAGYREEITWQERLSICDNATEFFAQYMWVVLSSGMKNQIARLIEGRILRAWHEGRTTAQAFNHKGKVKAIDYVRANQFGYFVEWSRSEDQLEYLEKLPFIGQITKYHLAKNLGLDVVKPDRHLVRIAGNLKTTPLALCQSLSRESGYRIGTVDLIIWRAANLGYI